MGYAFVFMYILLSLVDDHLGSDTVNNGLKPSRP